MTYKQEIYGQPSSLIVNLTDALSHLAKCCHERDKAKADCSRDWGYFGFDYDQKVETAQAKVEEALNGLIDQRIEFKNSNTENQEDEEDTGRGVFVEKGSGLDSYCITWSPKISHAERNAFVEALNRTLRNVTR